MRYAHVPIKQAVISPSALSLMYPAENLPGYTREEFINDLLGEHEKGDPGVFRERCAHGSDRFHRGPAGSQKSIRPGLC
jgi:hypothetical protein